MTLRELRASARYKEIYKAISGAQWGRIDSTYIRHAADAVLSLDTKQPETNVSAVSEEK